MAAGLKLLLRSPEPEPKDARVDTYTARVQTRPPSGEKCCHQKHDTVGKERQRRRHGDRNDSAALTGNLRYRQQQGSIIAKHREDFSIGTLQTSQAPVLAGATNLGVSNGNKAVRTLSSE